jgi:hypothetical protein
MYYVLTLVSYFYPLQVGIHVGEVGPAGPRRDRDFVWRHPFLTLAIPPAVPFLYRGWEYMTLSILYIGLQKVADFVTWSGARLYTEKGSQIMAVYPTPQIASY